MNEMEWKGIPLVGPPTMITATTLSFAVTILAKREKL